MLYNTSLLIDQPEQRIQGTIQFKEYAETMQSIDSRKLFEKRSSAYCKSPCFDKQEVYSC